MINTPLIEIELQPTAPASPDLLRGTLGKMEFTDKPYGKPFAPLN
jgi:hypothetical protein